MKTNYFKKVHEDRVIIYPDVAPSKTDAGILIPETVQEKLAPARGTVIAVGPGLPGRMHQELSGYFVNGKFKEQLEGDEIGDPLYKLTGMPVKVGERVLYSKQAGLRVEDPGTKKIYLVMRVTDVWVTV